MKRTRKIYYITRTWTINGNTCGNLRKVYADFLEDLGVVTIVCPNYGSSKIVIEKNLVSMPYHVGKYGRRWDIWMEKLRLKEDYLDRWVKSTFDYLKNIVTEDDLLFATTGGELACIKLAALLKQRANCKMIINFRDPVQGSHLNGEKTFGYRGVSRDGIAKRYSNMADAMIASSEGHKDILKEQFSDKKENIFSHYVGYIEQVDLKEKHKKGNLIRIVYSGAMSLEQEAEILYEALRGCENVKITYICENSEELKRKISADNVDCIGLMPHDQYLQYMLKNADVGFVSLSSNYAMADAFPSKIPEYMNLGIPLLASLPEGGAREFINMHGYGIACEAGNIGQIKHAALSMQDEKVYDNFVYNIQKDRDDWYCQNRKSGFMEIMRDLEVRGII